MSLVPTTTGSATAIGLIYPELQGKLNGIAVRVPLLNASLTDCVFEVARPTTAEEVNRFLREAAEGELRGILGFEERPLVSVDFVNDPRSSIVDGPSTMVVDGTQVKILAWYDNEWGYVNRLVELAAKVAASLSRNAAQCGGGIVSEKRCSQLCAWSPGPTGASRSPMARCECWCCCTFDRLGYSAVEIAFLFLFYEFFGIVTNLLGGWIAARSGLKVTLYGGLLLQIGALIMLALLQPEWARLTSVAYVMAAQALSGIAKDLTKMSAKSAIKVVVPEGEDGALFKWVARLTGSKNALKGAGFFLGGALLTALRLRRLTGGDGGRLCSSCSVRWSRFRAEWARPNRKSNLRTLFSKSAAVNWLSAARLFLFCCARCLVRGRACRSFWLRRLVGPSWQVGAFVAAWFIGYGMIQAIVPGNSAASRARAKA